LREFTLRCARAFGACVEQRDDDVNVFPKMPKLNTHHLDAEKRARARFEELRMMTYEAAKALFDAETAEYEKKGAESRKRCAELKLRYMTMRAQVEAWTPPSPEHEGLKKFMLEQIDLCETDWEPYEPKQYAADPVDWLRKQIDSTIQ